MKLTHKAPRSFGRWLLVASVIAIVVCEVVASQVTGLLGIRNNPLVVGVLGIGIAAALASVLFDGADLG